jgi:CheY-like chemotaxis protein
VELHGGTVRAESPGEGGGSTFTVEIPLADARFPSDAGGRARAASDEPAFAPSPVLRGARVLLVEDEPQTRMVVQWLLEQCEAEVTAVENAGDALEAFRAAARGRRFDAMLSDVGMPGQDGYELMRRVRALEREAGEPNPLPAVALTAYAGEEERKKALEAGFFVHLPKPIGPAALVRTVAKAIRQGGAEPEPQ